MKKKYGNESFICFEEHLHNKKEIKSIVKLGNLKRRELLKLLIVSMSTLFIEALQVAIRDRRPTWEVDTYPIRSPIFDQVLMKKMKEQCIDIVVIEAMNHQFTMIIDSLKKLQSLEIDIMLLVDSRVGEIYHHLKDEQRWTSITKNTSLDEFLRLLESFKSNMPSLQEVSLEEADKKILKQLAMGHAFEFIQRTHGLSAEEIDLSLYRINSYFKVSSYIESISKAFEQQIITYESDKGGE